MLAQRLLFEHTSSGDLSGFLAEHFDTTTGPKCEATSYAAIAERLALAPHDMLFVSEIEAELDAARAAGMQTALCVREGVADARGARGHRVVESLSPLE